MISIIGNGNVASHLKKALEDKTEVMMINPHTLANIPDESEIIIICVSDKAISEVAGKLSYSDKIVVHTSGSVPMDILKATTSNIGVFYPLQTFSKGLEMNYDDIPVFIEASNPDTKERLKKLAALITEDIREADSETRKKLHLASVFACNFTNALARISEDLLKDSGLDFSTLLPLMRQTVKKLEKLSPSQAQTGPAVRKDKGIISTHLQMLENKPEIKRLYHDITNLIYEKSKI